MAHKGPTEVDISNAKLSSEQPRQGENSKSLRASEKDSNTKKKTNNNNNHQGNTNHYNNSNKSKRCVSPTTSPPSSPKGAKKGTNNKHPYNKPSKSKKKKRSNSVSDNASKFVAMDCEMVGVGYDGLTSIAARVTIVDWHYNVLLDQFIRPDRHVTDYRTHVSGITPADIISNPNAVSLQTCRTAVMEILRDKILVGHGLRNDLFALGIYHPWHLIRDTARYEPYMKVRYPDDAELWPRKLKDLCADFLQIDIQPFGYSHSSYEDAIAAFELYKLVQPEWEALVQYKVKKTSGILKKQHKKLLKKQQQLQQQQEEQQALQLQMLQLEDQTQEQPLETSVTESQSVPEHTDPSEPHLIESSNSSSSCSNFGEDEDEDDNDDDDDDEESSSYEFYDALSHHEHIGELEGDAGPTSVPFYSIATN